MESQRISDFWHALLGLREPIPCLRMPDLSCPRGCPAQTAFRRWCSPIHQRLKGEVTQGSRLLTSPENHPLPTGESQGPVDHSFPEYLRGPAPGPLPIPKSTESLRVDPSCPWLRRADPTLAPSSERKVTANDRLRQDIRACPLPPSLAQITLQRSQWPRDKARLRAQLDVTGPPCLPTASLLWS